MKTYRVETDRLVIRCYKKEDAPLLSKAITESLSELKPWMPWAWNEPEPLVNKIARLENFQQQFEKGVDFIFGVFNSDETELLGSTGLHTRLENTAREIGYWVHTNHLRKGIATEMVCALAKTAFEIENLERLEIRCDKKNIASYGVAEKAGFILKDILKANTKDVMGNLRDTMVWEITKFNYSSRPLNDFTLRAFDSGNTRFL